MSQINFKEAIIYLEGFDSTKEYVDTETCITYGGDELMAKGIRPVYEKRDFSTFVKLYRVV